MREPVSAAPVEGVGAYKRVLKRILDSRPSGTRQRLAEALGKNRSFITQITNPNYSTPIPVQYIEIIQELCHFAPEERRTFLDAYRRAHPNRLADPAPESGTRTLAIDVPDLGDPDLNVELDRAIAEAADRMAQLVMRVQRE